jgi:hypothetical protein
VDLFSLILRLLPPEFQVIIISKSTARLPTQPLYPRPISSLSSLTLFYIMLSPAISFPAVLAISKPLSRRKLRCCEKRRQKVLFRSKQTEIVDLTTP